MNALDGLAAPEPLLKCAHEQSELRVRITVSGSKQYVDQCVECGRATSSPVAHNHARVRALTAEVPFDPTLHDRWFERYRIARGQRDTAWFAAYNAYLQTEAWRERRRLVMQRAGDVCEGCRQQPATQVHHLTYQHVSEEFLWELVAICDACHERITP
jgi:hypothetical protein